MDTLLDIEHIEVGQTRKDDGSLQNAMILRLFKGDMQGLVIEIGDYAYEMIDRIIKRESPLRPLIFELVRQLAINHRIKLLKVVIEKLERNPANNLALYHCYVETQAEGMLESRYALIPSEAVILSLYTETPLHITRYAYESSKAVLHRESDDNFNRYIM